MLIHLFDLGADEDVAFEKLQMLQGAAVSHGFEVVEDPRCAVEPGFVVCVDRCLGSVKVREFHSPSTIVESNEIR